MQGSLRRAATLGACMVLAACAIARPADLPAPQGLFRAEGRRPAELAPGPRALWYAAARPRYFEIGLADWREAPPPSAAHLPGWLARILASPAADDTPVGLIDVHAHLPLPSIVEVTNLATGATVRVRIERRAPLPGVLILLPTSLARALDADPAGVATVRVRYAAPVVRYDDPGTLRLAWRTPRQAPPAATPDAALAKGTEAVTQVAAVMRPTLGAASPPEPPLALQLRGPLPAPAPGPDRGCGYSSSSPAAVCR